MAAELTAEQRAELEAIAEGTSTAEDNGDRPPDSGRPLRIEHATDLGNARRLAARHGDELRYCHPWRSWLVWNGQRFRRDGTGEIDRRAKHTVASIYREAASIDDEAERELIAKHAVKSEAETRLRAMVSLAASEPGIAVAASDLDADPYLLSCANGTVDLRTGELRAADPRDLLTRGTDVPYKPNAKCPRWRQFLAEVLGGDVELGRFLQRLIGYSLTGDTREHVLAVLHGAGCNGKTTLVEIVKRLLGDLATSAAFDTFARAPADRGPRNDLARLHGTRMVVASESGEGRRLDETTVKQLTGGDTVAARFLYGEHFEFVPGFKLWLVTNHRPRVDGGDDAIWRRLRLVPFEQTFEGREDRGLRGALEEELPGILTWAVKGCLTWQRDGLGKAGAVETATQAYREDEDVLAAFLTERCAPEGEIEAIELRGAYEAFCGALGERPLGSRVLGRRLARKGIESRRGAQGRRIYVGVRLR